MKATAIIPARYASSRFPGKPLAQILGKPMIQHVYERVSMAQGVDDVIVATDDERIYNAVAGFGGKAAMTGQHACGSERVAAVCAGLDTDIVINVQGDEPAIEPAIISALIRLFDNPAVQMGTLVAQITDKSDLTNPSVAKVVIDEGCNAIYFSRSPIPYNRDNKEDVVYWKHIGIYGYRKPLLLRFAALPRSALELAEELEQLRAIENGIKIKVAKTERASVGVDLPEHIGIVEKFLAGDA